VISCITPIKVKDFASSMMSEFSQVFTALIPCICKYCLLRDKKNGLFVHKLSYFIGTYDLGSTDSRVCKLAFTGAGESDGRSRGGDSKK
jgi:hypothetical protein